MFIRRLFPCAMLICGIAFAPLVLASNSFIDESDFAVSKGIRSLRSKNPEAFETVSVHPGDRMIATFVYPVTWRAQFATTAPLAITSPQTANAAIQTYNSQALPKAVYDNGTATVRADKNGGLRLASPLSTYMFEPSLSPKNFLAFGAREALVLTPYLDSLQMTDPQPRSVAMVTDNVAWESKGSPRDYLDNEEKNFLKNTAPAQRTFEADTYIHSMSNVVTSDSTLVGQPSRIIQFETDRGKTHMKVYRELAVFSDFRTVLIEAMGPAADFDTFVMPAVNLLRQNVVITFSGTAVQPLAGSSSSGKSSSSSSVPPKSQSSSSAPKKAGGSSSSSSSSKSSSSSASSAKLTIRCTGNKAAVLLCRKQAAAKVKKP